ncbi:MAG TPA: MFS transporter [Anaerolineae bacterium]
MTTYPFPESVRQRITLVLFVGQSFFSAAMIAGFTLTPIIAASLSGSDSAAGVPNTVTLLGRAAAAYPLGWLLDHAGRRWGLAAGFLLAVLGSALAVISIMAASFIGFCLGAGLVGMGRAASEQSRYVAAEVQTAGKRAKVIGLIVFASTVGAVGGPLLVDPSGQLAARLGLLTATGPFMIGALLYFLALSVTVLFLRPDPLAVGRAVAIAERSDTVDEAHERPLIQVFANPIVVLAVAAMVISTLVMTLVMVITPLHMNHHDHGTQAISLVIMAHTLGMFGLSSVTGWLIDRFGRLAMIVAGALVLASATLLAPLSTEVPLLAFSLFLLGLGWNFCFIAGSSLLSDALMAHERGRAQGANEMLVALASGAGSLGTGAVFARGGMAAVGAVGLAFALALIAAYAWLTVSRRLAQPDHA